MLFQIIYVNLSHLYYENENIQTSFVSDSETIGGLFHDAVICGQELSVIDRIWDALLDLVQEIAQCFGIEDEGIFDMLVNRADKLNHFVKFHQLKTAS